jgi:gluconolactonase
MLVGGLAAAGCATQGATPAASLGGVRRISADLDRLVAADARVEQLGEGFRWAEGPVWVRRGGYLLFSDVPGNVIYRWSRADGVTEFLRPSGYAGPDAAAFREAGSNGLAIDASGALVMCDHGNRALARMDLTTRRKELLVERYDSKRFNSPNDLSIARSGAIYFTDPPYGLAGLNASPLKELSFNGVYRLRPGGGVDLVDDGLSFPNGVTLTPDERTLYVANSDPQRPIIKAYALGADGMPTSSSIFFDAASLTAPDAPGLPDGLKVDEHGDLFATGPGGVLVLSPDARLLGVIHAGRAIANCGFGEDGRTLFLTAHDRLGRIRLRTRGVGWA